MADESAPGFDLRVCEGCKRHVFELDARCPFCDRPRPSLAPALGALAITAGLALAGCSSEPGAEVKVPSDTSTAGSTPTSPTAGPTQAATSAPRPIREQGDVYGGPPPPEPTAAPEPTVSSSVPGPSARPIATPPRIEPIALYGAPPPRDRQR
jgi:hypothetical protein